MSLAALMARIEREIFLAADQTALVMEKAAIQAAPKGASEPGLDKSIHGHALREGDVIIARLLCTAPHGKYLEYGTGPAAGHGQYMPPAGALRQWVQRKLGIQDPGEIERAERAVRWKIYMKGTEPQPFMKPGYDKGRQQWTRRLNAALKKAIHG